MQEEEIMNKLERFLEEKAQLDNESCYFITKKLNEQYWDKIQSEGEEEEIDEDGLEDFEDEEDNTEQETNEADPDITSGDIEDDESDFEEEPKKKSKPLIKRPKIRTKP